MKHLWFCLFVFSPALLALGAPKLIVHAGDYDRQNSVVEFEAPGGLPKSALLADTSGREIPLQVIGTRATFVLPALQKGEHKEFTLTQGGVPLAMTASEKDGAVTLAAWGKTALVYHTAKTAFPANRPDLTPIYHRAGYIHPVFSPSGAIVTDDYPRNHKHHHGIWLSWSHALFEGRTNDYWNMGEGKGTMEFLKLDRTWNGPVHAGFASQHQHVDLTGGKPKAALNETWEVQLYAAGAQAEQPYFLFDVNVTDSCATAEPVLLPLYRYGGICVRGNWAWNGKTNAQVLTSEGETDRSKGDKGQVHARWVHLGGIVQGTFSGIAGLAHPSNFRSPEPVRLNAAEPYFNFTPQQAGDMEITPTKPWTGRYRFVIADGKPDQAVLERLWNDYAHPPTVEYRP